MYVQIPQQGVNTSVHALQLQFNSDSNQQPVNLCLLGSVLPFLPGFPSHFPPIGSQCSGGPSKDLLKPLHTAVTGNIANDTDRLGELLYSLKAMSCQEQIHLGLNALETYHWNKHMNHQTCQSRPFYPKKNLQSTEKISRFEAKLNYRQVYKLVDVLLATFLHNCWVVSHLPMMYLETPTHNQHWQF